MNGLRKISAALTAALALGGALGFGGASGVVKASNGGASGARRMEAIAKEEGTCFALLIGVDKYDNLRPLNYAGADAKALRDTLLKLGFSKENVWILTSDGYRREQPTKKNIEDALDEMLAETGPDSTVFVAFSGHGYETKDGVASFCPKDVEVEKKDGETYVAKNTAITVGDVAARLRADDAKFKILFVDACREPATTRSVGSGAARPFSKADVSGLAFLQSCRSTQLSYEDAEFKGGIFTRYFIEGLSGAAERDDGGTSFLDVCGYAASKTKERALETHKATQTPFYEFAGSDFWLKEPTGDVAEALYREGREAAFGLNGAKIDGRRGLELLTKAADAGSTDAQAELAELYLSGCEGTPPDATRAFGLAFEPARRGNPFALNVLGRCYVEGRGVAKAEKKAATCFERAFRGSKSERRRATFARKRRSRRIGRTESGASGTSTPVLRCVAKPRTPEIRKRRGGSAFVTRTESGRKRTRKKRSRRTVKARRRGTRRPRRTLDIVTKTASASLKTGRRRRSGIARPSKRGAKTRRRRSLILRSCTKPATAFQKTNAKRESCGREPSSSAIRRRR